MKRNIVCCKSVTYLYLGMYVNGYMLQVEKTRLQASTSKVESAEGERERERGDRVCLEGPVHGFW